MADVGNPVSIVDNAADRERITEPFSNRTFDHIRFLTTFLIGVMAFFGTITNVFNIVMFYRQGIRSHSCNVSLSAMAVSDFFYSFLALVSTLANFIARTEEDDHTFVAGEFQEFLANRPGKMFSDITACITSYVVIERCVCVVLPFKAHVFTAKRSGIVILCITLFLMIINTPYLIDFVPGRYMKLHPLTRKPIMAVGYVRLNLFPRAVVYILSIPFRLAMRTTWFIVVLLCNVVISLKVALSQKFRKSKGAANRASISGNSGKEQTKNNVKEEKTTKEMKLVKMILAVCIVFTVCCLCEFVYNAMFIFSNLENGFDYHHYTRFTMEMIVVLSNGVNSSINIVVYYSVSTRFRQELRLCLRIKEE